MIISCESCSRKFVVKDIDIPKAGRTVQCGYCSVTWHQMPNNQTEVKATNVVKIKEIAINPSGENEKIVSDDVMKASDGKKYKFLGNQWAELLPSGKTGIFAKKKITRELNKITGKKISKPINKKNKKRTGKINPSGGIDTKNKLPEIYTPKTSIGFLGYIFLIIIIGFSLVGVLKTFENDLINLNPKTEYIFILLDSQLEFLAESVKNMIIIIKDLINYY